MRLTYLCKYDIVKQEVRTMIKASLKKFHMTQGELASALNISRPTLASYIELFEQNKRLPNDKYQVIFEGLFNDEIDTQEKFEDMLAKFSNLIERDIALGTLELSAASTDLFTSIYDGMIEDMKSKDYCEDVYRFINFLIHSYKTGPFKKLARYFLYLNGKIDVSLIQEEEKPFLSNIYKVMYDTVHNQLTYDEESFQRFLERIEELKRIERGETEAKLNEIISYKVKDKLKAAVREQLSLGKNLDDIDFDLILQRLDFAEEQ